MPENNTNIEIRSDEVQEIMSRPPSWMIRWGISLIFAILVVFIFLAWFIKYPDVIKGAVTLTTITPPVKLIVKMPGELEIINAKDNSSVIRNQHLASIKSNLSNEARIFLLDEISKIQAQLKNKTLDKYEIISTKLVFGDLENSYLNLITALKSHQSLITDNNLTFNIKNASTQLNNQRALLGLTVRQLANAQKLMLNADSKFNADKTLFDKGIISQSEYFDREKAHKMTISDLQNLEKDKIQSAIIITDLEKQLHTLTFDFENKKKTNLQEINTLIESIKNALSTWKQGYELISPIDGKLSYLKTLSKHEFIASGTALFAIIPKHEGFIAYLKIPNTGYGKVKLGQKVMLKIDNFPYYEYGQLIGKVASISLIPDEKDYLVKVKLTNGLVSSYNKTLKFTPEMSGQAEIITEDLRITDRIFNQFRKVLE